MSGASRFAQVARLAAADAWFERLIFLCFALALAAVLAPLLILYGLKFGIVAALTERLLADPATREVVVLGNRLYPANFLAQVRAHPEVAFFIPRTRSIGLQADFSLDGRGNVWSAELIPSGPGDPMLGEGSNAITGTTIAISQPLADALSLRSGDVLYLIVGREGDGGRPERQQTPVTVAQVLAPTAHERRVAYVSLDLLMGVEDYREGEAVKWLGWPGHDPAGTRRSFASFRVYAKSLDDVAPLADWLIGQNVEVISKRAEIEQLKRLDANLSLVFSLIAALGIGGTLVSQGSTVWSNVERKRRDLSMIRLMGMPARQLVFFPVLEALIIAAMGLSISFCLYAAGAAVINQLFADYMLNEAPVCRLRPLHFAMTCGLILLGAIVSSSLAAWKASLIEPAEGLHSA